MVKAIFMTFSLSLFLLACQPMQQKMVDRDQCGASNYVHLVGQPLPPIDTLDIPGNSRYYGAQERVASDNPQRLNFVLSTENAADAFIKPENATVLRVFCG